MQPEIKTKLTQTRTKLVWKHAGQCASKGHADAQKVSLSQATRDPIERPSVTHTDKISRLILKRLP